MFGGGVLSWDVTGKHSSPRCCSNYKSVSVDITVNQSGALEVQDSLKHTVTGGHARKESIMGGIIILLTPPRIIDPFPAWMPPLCY